MSQHGALSLRQVALGIAGRVLTIISGDPPKVNRPADTAAKIRRKAAS